MAGAICLAAGGLCIVFGLVDFFMAFGKGMPERPWLFFVGIPLLWLGAALLVAGWMGAWARYQAGEAAPVAKDTFNYMAEGTQDGVRTLASAVGEGLRGEGVAEGGVPCPQCDHLNDADAKFCDDCGAAMRTTCPGCETPNDPDARFCDNCGTRLGS